MGFHVKASKRSQKKCTKWLQEVELLVQIHFQMLSWMNMSLINQKYLQYLPEVTYVHIYIWSKTILVCIWKEWDLSIKVHILDCNVSTITYIISLLLSTISAVVTDAYKRKVLF